MARLPGFQASRLPGSRLPGFLVLSLPGFQASRLQASRLPGFQASRLWRQKNIKTA